MSTPTPTTEEIAAPFGVPGTLPTDLSEENMKAYWEQAWDRNQTGWKTFEVSKPFRENVLKCLAATERLGESSVHPADDDDEAVVRRFVEGKRVLVPLCGDSYALRFFADMGASLVVGVDLATSSLMKNIADNFSPNDGFSAPRREDDAGATWFTIVKEDGCSAHNHRKVQLIAGSFFDVNFAAMEKGFDLIYDRAAMVALPPTLRSVYVKTLAGVVERSDALVVLELIRRRADEPEALTKGPPYDIPIDTVESLYQEAVAALPDGNSLRITVTPVSVLAAVAFATGTPLEGDNLEAMPPFRFALYAVEINSALGA